jgi:hypothetical protein
VSARYIPHYAKLERPASPPDLLGVIAASLPLAYYSTYGSNPIRRIGFGSLYRFPIHSDEGFDASFLSLLRVLSVSLRKEGGRTYFWEESPRIRRTEVRPTRSRRAISALATPARCSVRISAACAAAVAGRPRRLPFCRAWANPARVRSPRISRSNAAYCGEPQYSDNAERGIMQSHSAEVALWPAYQ